MDLQTNEETYMRDKYRDKETEERREHVWNAISSKLF